MKVCLSLFACQDIGDLVWPLHFEKNNCYILDSNLIKAYCFSNFSGLPKRNNDHHASEIANFALALLHLMKTKTFLEFGRRHIQLRIGINSGN